MTTNVLLLPKLSGAGTSFTITTNSGWDDSIFFGTPGSPTLPLAMVGQITSASNVITVQSTIGLIPGMPISHSPGIPLNAFVGAISSATQITMVDGSGASLNATASNAEAALTFQPPPLDLTGISFVANLKASPQSSESYLTVQTSDGTFNNGGVTGVLSFDIPVQIMARTFPGTYVMDIIAEADGATVNLFPIGPATVIVLEGVTDPTT